ncbi:MAG: Hsp20/alpha crystallin family protein [Phaeodactylibacter sp.]|nr:Hsp20/alpha crystallin family protein [Phaeodactylibacter sp.]MCB9266492.1 Hsp20/alpha crystallin family protein [Lewinellaceae bacterium]MCB9289094.1 Hsp20/alpha crystallin family protein [Lewinellaceae bacterium]
MWRAKIKNRSFDRMGEEYARLIDPNHFLGRSAFDIHYKNMPPVNIIQEGKLFEMEVIVPGFTKEELAVTVKDDILTIRGEKSVAPEDKKGEYILEEFGLDSFERKFKLARAIGHEKITAKYENGILRLTFIDVPKEEEKAYKKVAVE